MHAFLSERKLSTPLSSLKALIDILARAVIYRARGVCCLNHLERYIGIFETCIAKVVMLGVLKLGAYNNFHWHYVSFYLNN